MNTLRRYFSLKIDESFLLQSILSIVMVSSDYEHIFRKWYSPISKNDSDEIEL